MPVLRVFPVRPTKASPSFPAERERVQLQRGNTFTTRIAPPLGQSVFFLPHENIPNLLQDTQTSQKKISQRRHKHTHTHTLANATKSPHLTNQQSSQALLYNRRVSFCWRKQYSPPPMLIVSIFIMSLQEFPMNLSLLLHSYLRPICRITLNKLYETMLNKNKGLCSYFLFSVHIIMYNLICADAI